MAFGCNRGRQEDRLPDLRLTSFCSDHDNRNSDRHLLGLQLLQELETCHDGHIDVAHDQVDPVGAQERERFGAVAGLEDLFKLNIPILSVRNTTFLIMAESSTTKTVPFMLSLRSSPDAERPQ